MSIEESERITTSQDVISRLHDKIDEQQARIAELEGQLEAIGAGGVGPLRKQAAAPQAVQADVPVAWRLTNTAFRKPRFEYHDTKESAEQRQADFNRSVDDGGLHNLTPLYAAPAHPSEGVPAQAEPFMWAIQEPGGSAYMDENCVSTSRGIVEAEVDGLNLGLGADDEPYKVVPVYLAATQPAAQGMEADLADEQIDEAFNQMPDGAAGFLKSWGYRQFARAVLAAQAKQGGAANG